MKKRRHMKIKIAFFLLDEELPEPEHLFKILPELKREHVICVILTRSDPRIIDEQLVRRGMDGFFAKNLGPLTSFTSTINRERSIAHCDADEVLALCWNDKDLVEAVLGNVLTAWVGQSAWKGCEPSTYLPDLERLPSFIRNHNHSQRAR